MFMAKGFQSNREHQEAISSLGKTLSKRAAFKCEWCNGNENLRPWEYQPDSEPDIDILALLCDRCRDLAKGSKAAPNELHSIRNALWSDITAVSEGAARVLASCPETWARDAIEESGIDENLKTELLR
jgi:protein PhnA